MFDIGTQALACGLRWDSQYLTRSAVKVLTFSIDPSVRLSPPDSGPLVTLNLLPLFWTPRLAAAPQLPACPRHIHVPLMRNLLQARLSCAAYAIRRTNHTSYESYSISTTQHGNGTWVAAFGKRHRDAARTGPGMLPVSETRPEVAEVIALADAQIEIDDRLAGKAPKGAG